MRIMVAARPVPVPRVAGKRTGKLVTKPPRNVTTASRVQPEFAARASPSHRGVKDGATAPAAMCSQLCYVCTPAKIQCLLKVPLDMPSPTTTLGFRMAALMSRTVFDAREELLTWALSTTPATRHPARGGLA